MKHRIVFAAMMSFVLSLLMSAWVTFMNIGAHPEFVSFWLHAWIYAWPAAAAISFVFAPFLHQLATKITSK